MKRVGWIDAARYIAIFHVVFIHTLDTFSPRVLDYWVTPPTSYIPFLLNAKTAVLFFCSASSPQSRAGSAPAASQSTP